MGRLPCFDSLFYRQRLHAVGIPFLLAVALFCFAEGMLSFLFAFFASFFFLVLACLAGDSEKRATRLCASAGVALALISVGSDQYSYEKASSHRGEEAVLCGYVTWVGEESFDLSCYSCQDEVYLHKIRIAKKDLPSQGQRLRLRVSFLPSLSSRERQDRVYWKALATEGGTVTGKSLLYSSLGALRQNWKEEFGSDAAGGFLRAILLGDRTALDPSDEASFRLTASSHLLAISGIHISVILGILFFVFRLLPIHRRILQVLFLFVTVFLILLTGASVSVFRAGFMTMMSGLAVLFRRDSDSVTALVLAAVLLVLAEPYAVCDLSFLFSFSSTFGILVSAVPLCEWVRKQTKKEKKKKWLYRSFTKAVAGIFSAWIVAICVFVYLFPVQILSFGSVQLLTPIASALIIPLFAPCLIAGMLYALSSSFSVGVPLFSALSRSLAEGFLWVVRFLAKAFPEECVLNEFSAVTLAVFAALGILYIMARKRPVHVILFHFCVLYSLCALCSYIP